MPNLAEEIEILGRNIRLAASCLQDIGGSVQRIARLMGEHHDKEPTNTPEAPRVALGPDEIAKVLGYTRKSLRQMRASKSPLLDGLPMFKLCDCEATRRKTQGRCNHPYYAWESDVEKFFKQRQERYQSTLQSD